jgi:YtkA-like
MRRIALLAAALLPAVLPAAAAAKSGHRGGDEAALVMGAAPPDIRAGHPWKALVLASRGNEPLTHQNIAVTVSNPYTGRAQTYYSDETAPGHYEAEVVFPTKGTWEIVARGGGLVADAPAADVAPAPADPSPLPWVLGAAAAAIGLAGVFALARRARHRRGPAPAPAEG